MKPDSPAIRYRTVFHIQTKDQNGDWQNINLLHFDSLEEVMKIYEKMKISDPEKNLRVISWDIRERTHIKREF